MLRFSRRRRRKIVTGRIIEETARHGEKGMKIGRDESEYMCICMYVCAYVCVCVCVCVYTYVPEDGCRRLARVGSAILQRKPLAPGQGRVSLRIGIRCSTPGYQQECFPHSDSLRTLLSRPPLFATIYLHNIRGGRAENVCAPLCIQGRVLEISRD